MQYRPLGASDLNISALAFGAWQLGDQDYWSEHDEADAARAVHAAIDGGINFFDTAELYGQGESERVLGQVLGTKRDQVYIASKVAPDHCAPDTLRACCEASLQRLGTEYLDLYQIHWPFDVAPVEDVCAVMEALKKEGKIRHIGVSNFGARDLGAWLDHGSAISDQLGYNLFFRAIEYDIVPTCVTQNVGILAYMPLLQGILAGKWDAVEDIPVQRRRTRHFSKEREQTRHTEMGCEALLLKALTELRTLAAELDTTPASLALAWAMAQPGITSVIVGGRNSSQMERNLAATELALSEGTLQQLNEISQPMKEQLGANADLWQGEAGSRIH